MTAPRCRCWNPTRPHEPTCAVAKAKAETDRKARRLLAGIQLPRRSECG